MDNTTFKTCVQCNLILLKSDTSFRLAVSAPTSDILLFDMINYIHSKDNVIVSPMEPLGAKNVEKRCVCKRCATTINSAYKALVAMKDRLSNESYISKCFCQKKTFKDCSSLTEITSNTFVITKINIPEAPKTPIAKKMWVAKQTKRQFTVLQNTIKTMVHKEITELTKMTTLQDFNDRDGMLPSDEILLDEMEKYCPLTLKIFQSLFIKKHKKSGFSPQLRVAIGISVYVQNQKVNGLQKALGITLYKSEAPKSVYRDFQKLGISVSYQTTLKVLDRIRQQHDQDLWTWREGATNFFLQLTTEKSTDVLLLNRQDDADRDESFVALDEFELESMEVLQNVIQQGSFGSLFMRDRGQDVDKDMASMQIAHCSNSHLKDVHQLGLPFRDRKGPKRRLELQFPNPDEFYGMSFAIDNLNKQVKRQDYSSNNRCKDLAVTSAFSIFNRIPSNVQQILHPNHSGLACDIPLNIFLPSVLDIKNMKDDHAVTIKRILVGTMKIFAGLKKEISWCTDHEYTSQSCLASRYVNLGIFAEDENTSGEIKIQDPKEPFIKLLRYLPMTPSGRPLPTVIFGDGLSAERMRGVILSRANSDNEDAKLKEIVPGISHWHRRCVIVQDDWEQLAKKMVSSFSRGTVPNFRGKYGHEKVTAEFKKSFNQNYKLLRFTMESYVIATAMKHLNFGQQSFIEHVPSDFQENLRNKAWILNKLEEVTHEILDFEWHRFEKTVQQEKYCLCKVEWKTEDTAKYLGCENPGCFHYTWYHRKCLKNVQAEPYNIFRPPPGPGKKKKGDEYWYCSDQCKDYQLDKKWHYSRGVVFAGLMQEGFKSAIRANDGKRMLSYFRFHTIQLYNVHHTMYFRNAHNMLARLVGYGPAHISNDLMWNSTVNWSGTKNHNIEIDLANEMLNKIMKEFLLASGGSLTKNAIERRSQSLLLFKELKYEMEKITGEEEGYQSTSSKDYRKDRTDLNEAIKIILKDDLLQHIGRRHHEGFEDFSFKHVFVDNIVSLKKAICDESSTLDSAHEYVNEYRASASRVDMECE